MRGASQQVMLDSYFGSLGEVGDLHRGLSVRGFAKARDRLSWYAQQRLNAFVVQTADRLGLIERWRGLRVVATDASVFFPAVRACANLKGFAASPNQRLVNAQRKFTQTQTRSKSTSPNRHVKPHPSMAYKG
jgi:hypothetical protein